MIYTAEKRDAKFNCVSTHLEISVLSKTEVICDDFPCWHSDILVSVFASSRALTSRGNPGNP